MNIHDNEQEIDVGLVNDSERICGNKKFCCKKKQFWRFTFLIIVIMDSISLVLILAVLAWYL